MKDPLRIEVPIAVAVGGAIGAVARWFLATNLEATSGFPVATFVANVSGTFALGVVLVLGEKFHPHNHRTWARLWRPFLGTGVLGGYTTFSTLTMEVVRLHADLAITYTVASVVFGLLAYSLGNGITRKAAGIAS